LLVDADAVVLISQSSSSIASKSNPQKQYPKMTVMLPQHLQLCTPADAPVGKVSPCVGSSSSNPYLVDQLHHMLDQESNLYQSSDYLNPANGRTSVTPSDRRTMCSWSYDIVDACSIDREIAVIGTSYFDRFMSSPSPRARQALTSRRSFQLSFITCLIISLKCRAGMQVDSDFVSDTICQGLYDADEIVECERDVLAALGWRLNGPSGHDFVGGLLELLPENARGDEKLVEEMRVAANVRIEAAVTDYETAMRPASSVAYAALLTAMSNVSASAFHPIDRLAWVQNIGYVTGLKAGDFGGSLGGYSAPSSPMISSSSPNTQFSDSVMMCSPAASTPSTSTPQSYRGYYCSPVSSDASTHSSASSYRSSATSSIRTTEREYDEAELYLSVLSRACSSGSEGSGMSPVCSMFDERL
jgi:hypothetical protein